MSLRMFLRIFGENLFLNGVEATVCQENHGTSGHMDWEYHVGRTSSGQAERKCSCDGTFVDPCFRMMRGPGSGRRKVNAESGHGPFTRQLS